MFKAIKYAIAVLASPLPAIADVPPSCDDPLLLEDIKDAMQRQPWLNLGIGTIHIEILDIYDIEPNRGTHDDDGKQCLMTEVTNYGEVEYTYGWHHIRGERYVYFHSVTQFPPGRK